MPSTGPPLAGKVRTASMTGARLAIAPREGSRRTRATREHDRTGPGRESRRRCHTSAGSAPIARGAQAASWSSLEPGKMTTAHGGTSVPPPSLIDDSKRSISPFCQHTLGAPRGASARPSSSDPASTSRSNTRPTARADVETEAAPATGRWPRPAGRGCRPSAVRARSLRRLRRASRGGPVKATVLVRPKDGILDPQGEAVGHSCATSASTSAPFASAGSSISRSRRTETKTRPRSSSGCAPSFSQSDSSRASRSGWGR